MKSFSDMKANIISAFAGGLVFLIFLFSLDVLWIAVGLAGATYIGFMLLLNATSSANDKDFEMLDLTDLTDKKIETIIRQGAKKIQKIQTIGQKIAEQKTKKQIFELTQIAQSIFQSFRNNPDDIKAASHFLPYYLNTAYKLARKYVEVSQIKISSKKVDEIKLKINASISVLKDSLQKQHDKLLQNDIFALDTETQILQDTIQMEDFQ